MSNPARAIGMALGSFVCVSAAQAASYVVVAKGQSFDTQLARRVEAAGGTITARLPQIGVAIVEAGDAGFVARAAKVQGIRSVNEDLVLQFDVPEVHEIADEDYVAPPNAVGENDTFYNLQWGNGAVDAAGAWNQGYFGNGVRVAVLDSGLYCQHRDIAPNLIAADSISFVAGEPNYCHTSGSTHGTHTAGTILAADNGIGTIGIAPQAKLIAVKVLRSSTGSGSFGSIIQGIVHAADKGADVINMSLGATLPVGGNDVAELINATARATRYASAQNALVVVAAGNDGRDLDHDSHAQVCDEDGANCFYANLRSFPAQLPAVLSISATAPAGWAKAPNATDLDGLSSYSNHGQSAIDFAAPGGDFRYPGTENCALVVSARPCWIYDMVISTTSGLTGYGWSAGTSMAAPHVAGVAALVIGKHGGEMAPSEVERILRASADDLGKPGNDSSYGGGRVNAARAVYY